MINRRLAGCMVHYWPIYGAPAPVSDVFKWLRFSVAVDFSALVPFDGGPPRAIFLDVTAVASHAPPQSNILVLRGRL